MTTHDASPVANPDKERVEAMLRELQDRHRLAIHTIEIPCGTLPCDPYKKAEFIFEHSTRRTLTCLNGNDALSEEAFADGMKTLAGTEKKNIAVFSMSLVPDSTDGKSIKPYAIIENYFYTPCYLFDISEDCAPRPARVVAACKKNLWTGFEPYNKEKINPLMLDEDNWKYEMGKGLEKIVTDQHTHRISTVRPNVSCNEILVAAGRQHLRAICIPLICSASMTSDYMKAAQLRGALEGLSHLKEGIDLPVVLYHIAGERMGQFTYLAQGKEELTQKAQEIIDEMRSNPTLEAHIGEMDMSGIIALKLESEMGVQLSDGKNLPPLSHIIVKPKSPAHVKNTISRNARGVE